MASRRSGTGGRRGEDTRATVFDAGRELEIVGRVAAALSPDDLRASLDEALDILCHGLGADDGEALLTERRGGDLLLTTCRGPDAVLLASRARFPLGAGFPGMAAHTGRPLLTDELSRDVRYLRSQVPRGGVRACVEVPLLGADAALGAIGLYWRRGDVPLERAVRVAELAARPIAAAVRAGRPAGLVIPSAALAAPTLRARCLGGFTIHRGDQPIPPRAFPRKKAVTLLQILLLRAGRPIERDALAEILWPGLSSSAAPNRVHVVVNALRDALEPGRESRDGAFVRSHGDLYFLDGDAIVETDVARFRELRARGLSAERNGSATEACRHFDEAAACYGGDLFEDAGDASWCEGERAELRAQWLDLLRRGAALHHHLGDPELAAERLRAAVRADPYREDLQRELVGELLRLGRRGEAAAQYRECLRLLREELDAEPQPSTRALEALLRRPR